MTAEKSELLDFVALLGLARSDLEHLVCLAENICVDINWHMLAKVAEEEGMTPLLYSRCRAASIEIPYEIRRQLHLLSIRHQAVHQIRSRAMGEILAAGMSIGIEMVLVKGAALAWSVYSDPGLRPTQNMEILTSSANLDKLKGIFLASGYRLTGRKFEVALSTRRPMVFTKKHQGVKVVVFVHHSPVELPWLDDNLTISSVIKRAKDIVIDDMPVLTPHPEEMLKFTYGRLIDAGVKMIHISDFIRVAEMFGNQIDWTWVSENYPGIPLVLSLLHHISEREEHLSLMAEIPISSRLDVEGANYSNILRDIRDCVNTYPPANIAIKGDSPYLAVKSLPDNGEDAVNSSERYGRDFRAVWDCLDVHQHAFHVCSSDNHFIDKLAHVNAVWVPETGIPNIIHQTWKNSEVPDQLAAFHASWNEFHPDWQKIFWTDSDLRTFIKEEYDWFLPIFDSYPEPIMRVDAARYFLLYHYGGVYADLDFEALKPLDSLLVGKDLLLGQEPAAHKKQHFPVTAPFALFVCNALMASSPKHPFWLHVIERLIHSRHIDEPMEATGPFLLSRAYARYLHKEHVSVESSEILYPIFAGDSQQQMLSDPLIKERIASKAYAVHHWNCTWWDESSSIRDERAEILFTKKGETVKKSTLRSMPDQAGWIAEQKELPRVICLLVNYDQLFGISEAQLCFQNQTYPNRELWLHTDIISEKYNRGKIRSITTYELDKLHELLEQAGAHYFVLWQADALHDASRLATQVIALETFQAKGCLLSHQRIWVPDENILRLSSKGIWPLSLMMKVEEDHCWGDFRGDDWHNLTNKLCGQASIVWLNMPQLLTQVKMQREPDEARGNEDELRGEAATIMVQKLENQLQIDLSSLKRFPPIPKIIHQTWKDSNIPPELIAFQQTWRQLHPDWTFVLWTDEANRELIREKYTWFLPIYDAYPETIMRADAVRYFILHSFGGVYIDLDFSAFRPLDSLLLDSQLVFGVEPAEHLDHLRQVVGKNFDQIIGNAFMAAVPEHPFWQHVFQCLVKYAKDLNPLVATGPFFLTRAYSSYEGNGRISLKPAELLYPINNTVGFGDLNQSEQCRIAQKAYAIHHWYGSWWRQERLVPSTPVVGEIKERDQSLARFHIEVDRYLEWFNMDNEHPLISAMMVTKNRPDLAKRSINCFLKQTYPEKELVILDDGEDDRLEAFIDKLQDPQVRYFRIDSDKQKLGELRNLAVEFSLGEFVAQWDDDDLSDPRRLAIQIAAIVINQVDTCLLQRHMIWYPQKERLAISGARRWEGSFVCRKSKMPNYPGLRKGEDTPVIEAIAAEKHIEIDYPQLYIYTFHGGNTWDIDHFEELWHGATQTFEEELYKKQLVELSRDLKIDLSAVEEEDQYGIQDSYGGESKAKVLILIPVKDGVRYIPGCLANLHTLTYPHSRISIGFLESDSQDGSFTMLETELSDLHRQFHRAVLLKKDFDYQFEGNRWEIGQQRRRREILAHSRNFLLSSVLEDEEWVLWLDVDVSQYPTNIIELMLAYGKKISVPNCLVEGTNQQFDLNTYKLKSDANKIDWKPFIVDDLLQPPVGVGRWYLNDLDLFDAVEVDAVGGTMLLIKADLHRKGLSFPYLPYKQLIETEGLAAMAKDLGYICWGLPKVVIHHSA